MKLLNKNMLTIKKSRFIALCYEIENVSEVKSIIKNVKEEYKHAKHYPYAYRLKNTAGKSDDKEPLNTAGFPIFNIIEKNDIENVLIIVVRYYGGTKLGAGGLIRAYSNSAKDVLKL